jgi:putative membrane protein
MQLVLIIGILFAIAAVLFSLQNNVPVMVTLAVWHFEGSLALVLLIALGLGALIAGLLSSPAVIGRQWTITRLTHQVRDLEKQLAAQTGHNAALRTEMAQLVPEAPVVAVEEKPYVGLKTLFSQPTTDDTPPDR